MVKSTLIVPLTRPKSFRFNVAGTVTPARLCWLLVVEVIVCVPVVNEADAGVAVGVGVGPGDAAAAGAAMAVAITGSDHATPATTLRRLKSLPSSTSAFAFKTSDNCAPRVGFRMRLPR